VIDTEVIELNEQARRRISAPVEMVLVRGTTHVFEESGTLETAAKLARGWFGRAPRGDGATPASLRTHPAFSRSSTKIESRCWLAMFDQPGPRARKEYARAAVSRLPLSRGLCVETVKGVFADARHSVSTYLLLQTAAGTAAHVLDALDDLPVGSADVVCGVFDLAITIRDDSEVGGLTERCSGPSQVLRVLACRSNLVLEPDPVIVRT
jgi:hypothetical protein